jgi:hypothetical protein
MYAQKKLYLKLVITNKKRFLTDKNAYNSK